jgi:hypothetical protein
MSRFEIFIGIWNTTGEVLAIDDASASALGQRLCYLALPRRRYAGRERSGLLLRNVPKG